MQFINSLRHKLLLISVISSVLFSPIGLATGAIGEHVNHLSDNLENYGTEVDWLNRQVNEMVTRYESGGSKAAGPDALIDYWEAVDFHSAIESNYVPIYAVIWQKLFALKTALEADTPMEDVRSHQDGFEAILWQALGAVKVAAQYQDLGLTKQIATTQDTPTNNLEAMLAIENKLNRVLAKYAEQLPDEAVKIVQDTYINLFEGVEGELITLDADLVEDLEKDFNVTLQVAIQEGKSVDAVRDVISAMNAKLDKAYSLLKENSEKERSVF